MCSELLTQAFRSAPWVPRPLGIRCSRAGPLISHLLYADDILVLADANSRACGQVLDVLSKYCGWTGQAINTSKSCVLFSKRTPAWKARLLASRLGFSQKRSFTYLGVLLQLSACKARDFDGLIQQAAARLRGWGVRCLSMAGRLALINSVLTSLPVFSMSHCMIPRAVLLSIEKLARTFLWQGVDGAGMHYVKWSSVCKPKDMGGLGIHCLEKWRGALLGNLAMRFVKVANPLLFACMADKYCSSPVLYQFKRGDSISWKLLCMGYSHLANTISWEVGNGQQISFLFDRWIMGRSLHLWPTFLNCNEDFPNLVAELILDGFAWDVNRLGRLCGVPLLEAIMATPLLGSRGPDRFCLEGRFSGTSVCSRIYRKLVAAESAHAWVWRLGLQPKVAFFWWRVCCGAVPTRAWLHTRGLSEELSCPWGCDAVEDLSHIVVSCQFLSSALEKLTTWGFPIQPMISLPQVFAWLHCVGRNKSSSPMALLFCTMVYNSWKNRLAKTHGRPTVTARMSAAFVLGNLSCGISSPLRFWDTLAPRGTIPCTWCPPPYGWLKVNFDGALLSDGRGGCAAVIRDHCGNLVVAKGLYLLHWDCGEVEMRALLIIRDFLMQWALEGAGIVVEGDCAGVIAFLQKTYTRLQQRVLVEDVDTYSFLLLFHSIIFSHVPRKCNKLADCAAHVAVGGAFLWEGALGAPPIFCSILRDEVPPVTQC